MIKCIPFFLLLLTISSVINAKEKELDTEYVAEFVEDMNKRIVIHFCKGGNDMFLKFTGLNESECISLVGKYSIECGKIITPLLPSLSTDDEDFVEDRNKVKNISNLYQMCIKSLVYEDVK